MKVSTVVMALCSIVMAGCASGPFLNNENPKTFVPSAGIQHTPELNLVVNAELGETLISRSYIKKVPAIKISKSIKHVTQNNGYGMIWNIPAEILLQSANGDAGVYYSSSKFFITESPVSGQGNKGGVVLGDEKSLSIEKVFWNPEGKSYYFIDVLNESVQYERIPPVEFVSEENFRRELIYTGISKNVITIIYREFKNDMARPAFTQELKYDLSEGRDIGYKGARFQIIGATNTGITYRVLKQLD